MPASTSFHSSSEIFLLIKGRKTGLQREVEVWFVYDEAERKIRMLSHKDSQWWKNIAKNRNVRYKFGNESSYHEAVAKVYQVNDKNIVQDTLSSFKKKYGEDVVRNWYGSGQDRIVVELSEV